MIDPLSEKAQLVAVEIKTSPEFKAGYLDVGDMAPLILAALRDVQRETREESDRLVNLLLLGCVEPSLDPLMGKQIRCLLCDARAYPPKYEIPHDEGCIAKQVKEIRDARKPICGLASRLQEIQK